MKFLKKLFGRKQEETIEWNVTPVSDLSTSPKPNSKVSTESSASGSAESAKNYAESNEQDHFESLPSAQEDMHEPLVQGGGEPTEAVSEATPSLIKPSTR